MGKADRQVTEQMTLAKPTTEKSLISEPVSEILQITERYHRRSDNEPRMRIGNVPRRSKDQQAREEMLHRQANGNQELLLQTSEPTSL